MSESFSLPAAARLRGVFDKLALLGALVVVFLFFTYAGPRTERGPTFSSARNIETLARQTAIVGTAALGMTVIIISGGIDLSVGSMVALVTVVVAWFLQLGWGAAGAAGMGILAGVACGLINGFLVTWLRVVPFIVTLGTLLIYRGAAKGIAREQKIDAPSSMLDELLAPLSEQYAWLILPPGVWMLLILAVLTAWMLHKTVFGRRVFAVGSNETAAHYCGVPVRVVRTFVYAIAGLAAGVAGLLQFARLSVGDPTTAVGLELDVIAAVVIGGGSLAGGQGSVFGTLIGAFIMTVIRSGCSQMGLPNWVQEIVTGSIIVIAVTFDRFRRRGK